MSQKEEESKEAGKEKNEDEAEEEEEEEEVPGSTLFIKNLNFSTTEEKLQEVGHFRRGVAVLEESEFLATYKVFSHLSQTFSKCGNVRSCTIAKKKDKSGIKQERRE